MIYRIGPGFVLLLLALGGCGVAKGVVEMPGKAIGISSSPDDPAALIIDLQQRLLRFTDSYQTGLAAAFERIRRDGNGVDPKKVVTWKLILTTSTTSIASGGNARLNLLDTTVFVTLIRYAVADMWRPENVGLVSRGLHDFCRTAEEDIWKLAAAILTPDQQAALREAVEAWQKDHPLPEEVLTARTAGFAAEVVAKTKTAKKDEGMFSFLNLDPLSNLDPAVRELTQARLLGERALFVTERFPMILRWQAELLSMNLLEAPQVKQLTEATAKVTASVERITAVAEKLPERVSKEREELVKALEAQEKTLAPMVRDVHQTVQAGTAMTEALNGTLKTLDGVIKRMSDAGLVGGPPNPNAEPFRIQEYIKAAAQAEATTKQLTEAIAAADKLIASEGVRELPKRIEPVVTRAESGARQLVDVAFTRGLLLIAAVLVAALIYRFASARMSKPS